MSNIKITPKQFNKINIATQFGEYLYNRLPKVYRDYDVKIERKNADTQKIETFKTLEEYLRSFALGGFQPLLEDLEAIINLVDPLKCPAQFLPYLLRHFGLDYIDDIPEKFQRRLVQNVVTLYKKKGTIPAVAFLARELSGFGVTIEEKSDGTIEFALVKLNAYEDEDAELLLAQDVVQRYIHLFLPARASSKIIVVYGFTENVHINAPKKADEDGFDHAYYNVDEVVGTITIDENGYEDVDGGYSESFNYLNHVVEKDFDSLKLKLEEELQNFQPRIPDLTSLTNLVENDGLPVFTNGISCEDVIKTGTVTLSATANELSVPTTSGATIENITASGKSAVLPIYKCTTDLHIGDVIEFKYDGKVYGYYTVERDLYASENYPTTFQLDIFNNAVKVYNQYFKETIDGSYDFTEYTGYSSFYTYFNNGSSNCSNTADVRIQCSYPKGVTLWSYPSHQPSASKIDICLYGGSRIYLSLKGVLTDVQSTKSFVTEYPITIIAPAHRASSVVNDLSGYTIAYKWLSKIKPEATIKTFECAVITLEDRHSVFSYESPNFTQSCEVGIQNKLTSEWSYYDLGMPLVSLGGYSESIEKHGNIYYKRSQIKEIDFSYICNNHSNGGSSGIDGESTSDWFSLRTPDIGIGEGITIYFNMCPCGQISKSFNSAYYNNSTKKYIGYPNATDVWDYFAIGLFGSGHGSMGENYTRVTINKLGVFSGWTLDTIGQTKYTRLFDGIFKYSDIPPKFYVYDKHNYYGGETLEEITDPVVINKLNLLPIPEECVIINSKGTGFAQIELSINSKVYY